MQNAIAAAGIVGVLAGCVGGFLVLRQQSFAGHALAHVGFTGAAGALLLGMPPLAGMVALTLCAGAAMGALGERLEGRDVAIGLVLAGALALGLLCLHFLTAGAAQATEILFGNVLGVDRGMLAALTAIGVVCLGALAAIARPLLFATVQPEVAEAQGVRLRLIGTLFLGVVALATAACAQIVGVLLVFVLMVAPAAAARRVTAGVWPLVGLAVVLAVAEGWLGLAMAWWTDWPASVCITALGCLAYLATGMVSRRKEGLLF